MRVANLEGLSGAFSVGGGRCYAAVTCFFKTEDGITDQVVTRIQTCALPIYRFGFFNRPPIKPYSKTSIDVERFSASDGMGDHHGM